MDRFEDKFMRHIEIIPLALKKVEQRKIPHEWIKETVNYPEQIIEGYMGRKVNQRRYTLEGKEMLLRVVVNEEKAGFIVITAYLTSQIERYWR